MTPTPRAEPRQWFRFAPRSEAEDGKATTADVYIYEQIGENWWGEGVGAKAFAQQIAELDVDTIRLFLNSPGGAAWEGITIMNALRRHRARVEVTVDGIAASAASVIAMAGDHITMNRGSELMIHDAWGYAVGNAQELADTSEVLHKLSDSIADTYAARAGGGREKWRTLMQAETWYTAEEAVTAGLADEWVDAPAADAHFDISKLGFAFASRAQAPAPRFEIPEPPSSTEPGVTNRKENVVAYDDLKDGLRERLGMTDAAASDELLLAAVDEALAEQSEPTTAAVPEGAIVVDAAAFAELQSNAAAGLEARDELDKQRRDGIIKAALDDGRIAPKSRDTWRAQLDSNETGTAELLASLPANTIPVTEIGHSDQPDAAASLYAAAFGDDEKTEA